MDSLFRNSHRRVGPSPVDACMQLNRRLCQVSQVPIDVAFPSPKTAEREPTLLRCSRALCMCLHVHQLPAAPKAPICLPATGTFTRQYLTSA